MLPVAGRAIRSTAPVLGDETRHEQVNSVAHRLMTVRDPKRSFDFIGIKSIDDAWWFPKACDLHDQSSSHASRLAEVRGLFADLHVSRIWDTAAAESFFSSLKIERVRRKVYRARNQARADVFDYIESFYNPTRRHSTNGY